MADYVVNLTGSAQVDDSIVEEFSQQTLIANGEMGNVDQFVTLREEIGSKQIGIPVYDRLSLVETPLNEREEADSEQLADSEILLTPKEYGKVVTKTALSSLQTGGKVDLAAARLVGINMAQSQSRLALMAGDSSSNVLFGGDATGDADLAAGDVLSGTIANKVYNKMARSSVPGLPQAMGEYIAIAHDDVLHDIRNESGFTDVKKYANPDEILRNEVGMYKGFRWIRNNMSTIAADVDTATNAVDRYNTYFLGFNGLGKAVSLNPQVRITGPFDKLARFVNLGWYGVFEYKIAQADAIWVAKTSSSVGANA